MTFDDEEDDFTSDVQDSAATDFSAQSRKRAPLDFSDLVPKGAGPTPARAAKKALDFSDLIPTVPAGQAPVPAARPPVEALLAGPRPRPAEAPAPTPLAPPPYDPMAGMTIDPVSGQPVPGEQSAAAPSPTPDMTAPTVGGFPAPQPLDEQPFRSGGTVLDKAYGGDGGMLSGAEAYDQQQARIKEAEQAVTAARARRDEAKAAHDEALMTAKLSGQAGDVYVQRQINQRTGFGKATLELQQAEKELQSAIKAPLPTQTGVRDTLERAPGAAVDQATQTARAAARIAMLPIEGANALGTKMMGTVRPALDPIKQAEQGLDDATKAITDKFSAQLFKKDEAQNERMGAKVVQGVVSTGMFAATGLAGRAAGLSPALTTAIAGALPQAEGQFQQAQRAQDITPGYAKAWMKHYGLDVSDQTANGIVKWSMFVTGLGIGATEAVPVAHLFDRLEKISGGGLTRWIGLMAAQAGEEGLQEGVQQLLENLAVKGLLDPNRTLDKEVADNAIVGAISGALVSGTMAAPAFMAGRGAQHGIPAPVEPAPVDLTGITPQPGQPPAAPPPTSPPQGEVTPPVAPEAPPTDTTPQPASPVSAIERRTLRKMGYAEDMIDGMSRAEAEAELGTAAEQGVVPDAEEAPSAEPVSDIAAQIKDMKEGRRDGVWLPKATIEHLRSTGQLQNVLRAAGNAQRVTDFDKQGGLLIARDHATGIAAIDERNAGGEIQAIIGRLTGDGTGKPAGADTVVQQQDEQGNVTRERLVTDEEAPAAAQEFAAPDRTVKAMPGTEALTQRADKVEAEQQAPADKAIDFTDLLPDGSRRSPAKVTDEADLARADAQVAPNPTPGQKGAENYKMGHIRWPKLGRVISIETAKGGTRSAVDGSWSVPNFPARYGRIKGTIGADGQQVDAFMGDDVTAPNAFIVDQYDPSTGKFDEHKLMLGFADQQSAERVYDAAYTDGKGPQRRGAVKAIPIADLKKWLARGKRVQPFSGQKVIARQSEQGSSAEPTPDVAKGYVRFYHGGNDPTSGGGRWVTPHYEYARDYREGQSVSYIDVPENWHGLPNKSFDDTGSDIKAPYVHFELPERLAAKLKPFSPREQASAGAPTQEELHGGLPHDAEADWKAEPVVNIPFDHHGYLPDNVFMGSKSGRLIQIKEDRSRWKYTLKGESADTLYTDTVLPRLPKSVSYASDLRDAIDSMPTQDAAQAVDDALAAIGIPPEQVDATDLSAAAKIVAETGADPAAAFQQVMAGQLEESTDAADSAGTVSDGVEEGTGSRQQAEGEQLPGRGEDGVEAPQGDQAVEGAEPDRTGNAEGTEDRPAGDAVEAAKTEDAGITAKPASLADAFATHLREGGEFKNILAARKMAKEAGFNADAKAVEEALEFGVVKLARQIVADRSDPKANFVALVDLYTRQPKLGTRTSTSMRDQAFSTPVPLAYVASRLAEVGPETTVYEPTAGNGALLIEANPSKTTANEINEARAANLITLGFKVMSDNAVGNTGPQHKSTGVVIANPPFGPVRQEGQSQVFDLSDIQNGYKTKEIDHAIALRALSAMRDDGRAVLIIGGLNKLTTSPEARSDAYNGKAKREFFKTLYDAYNVTDHFTVAGELYERQGAGWPVDVIVIDGRGKSERSLPAVDVPRVLNSWAQVGGLIDVSGRGNGANDRAPDRTASAGPGERDGRGRGDSRRLSEPDAGSQQPGEVQPGPVQRPADERTGAEGREEQVRDERGDADRTGDEPPPTGRPPGITADAAVTAALDEAFGPQAGPKSSPAPRKPRARTTPQVAASAVQNAVGSADAAFSGLYQLFGGGKTVGTLGAFDESTYAKAKPLFMQAAEKFAAFKNDIGELAKRMVVHMRDTLAWPRDVFERMRPYLVRFIEDVQKRVIPLGVIELPQRTETKAPASKQTDQETDKQVAYAPQSKSGGLGTLVPVNMRSSIQEALARIEAKVGPLDTYVAKELGYETDESGSPYFERDGERVFPFAAEQIDAIALAIDNINRDKGFIIGDQTGIGKGRVNAGILRWAMMNDRVPIFVTAKPNLYGDMYRDLTDIGIQESLGHDLRILATNSKLNVPLTEEDNPVVLKTGDSAEHKKTLNAVSQDNFTDKYDVLFTTYNQMQTVAAKDTDRRGLLARLSPNAVLAFDESHEAGGQGEKARKTEKGPQNRSDFARDLIKKAKGVFYSSATYAKRPDVMDLYAATDMSMAVEKAEDLGEAIARGGVPMQQVVAAMLAKAGQYIRRERSFAGVTYATPIIPVDRELYDQISGVLATIQDFSVVVSVAAESMDAAIKAEAEAMGHDNAVGGAGASSLLFTSIMHNVINQMLLALKAGPAAQMAIEALKAGQKPVITLANTMESLLSDYAAQVGLKPGDVINADFGSVLTKYLDRTRTLIIKKPFSKDPVVRKYLTDDELGKAGLAAYNSAKAQIDAIEGLSNLPASPIDRIKQDLANAGYKIGEITGRGTTIDYSGDEPVLRNRPGAEMSIRGRRETLQKFNNGGLDGMILNQAGSTGLSAHASEKYKDQRQRHMMIAQAEGNIDTHMQMLGRVHRTGQVVVPTYSQLVADIPAEKRPAAVLAKKMASLNASTTASREGALSSKDVPDFINQYGDMIAATIIADDPVLNHRLGNAVKIDDNGRVTVEDAMRRLTGRIPLLPLAEQEELYNRLEADYDALLEQMNAAGENALEAQTLDLKARPLERTEVLPAKSGLDSPFAQPVNIEKTSILRQGKSFSEQELADKLAEHIGPMAEGEKAVDLLTAVEDSRGTIGGAVRDNERNAREDALEEFTNYQRRALADIEDVAKQDKERTKQNATKDRFAALHEQLPTGARITLKTASGNITAIVIKTERTGEAKNPLALSSWKTTFAVADAARQVVLPFSRLHQDGKSSSDDMAAIEVAPIGWIETPAQTMERFASMQNSAREDRFIATGNLLAAYDWLNMRGRIINYTDAQGHIRQGILTSKDFDLGEHFALRARPFGSAAEVIDWMRKNKGETVWSEDNVVRMDMAYDRDLYVTVEANKRKGGQYFLDKPLTDITSDFYKRGGTMVANVQGADTAKITRIIERLQQLGARFVDRSEAKAPPAEKIEQEPEPEPDPPAGGGGTAQSAQRLTTKAYSREREITYAIRNAINQVAGWEMAQRAQVVDRIEGEAHPAWGGIHNDDFIIAGQYDYARDFIKVALVDNADALKVAYHEAWHSIERVLTTSEKELLAREVERLRDFVARYGEMSRADVGKIANSEVFAESAAIYTKMRSQFAAPAGMHIAVRRIFEKLREIMARIRSALNGMGFRTAEDIFADFNRGEMAQRRERADVAAFDQVYGRYAQSVRRRAGRPGDVIPAPETMRGAWRHATSWKQGISDAVDALLLTPTRAMWDRQIDLLRFQKAADAVGSPVSESLDTYLAATLYPGRAGERMKDAVKALWEPVYDTMRDRKISRDDMQDYLYARHAPERNAKIREIDPANDSGSGMTDEEAAEVMGRLLDRRADFEATAALIDRVVTSNRAVMLREGLESERTLTNWAEAYEHYVPLKGFEAGNDDDLTPSPSSGKGFDIRHSESYQALGRFDRADDILANLLDQTQRTIIRAEKNRVAKTFLRFAQANPSPYYKIGLAEKKRRINPLTGLVEEYWSNLPTHLERVFAAKVGGKTYYIEIKHQGLLDALKSLGADKMNPVMRLMSRLTREYSRFQTAKNPEFVFTNLTKDLQDAGFTLSGEKRTRLFRRYAANMLKGKALYGAILGTTEKGADTEARRWFEEWREAGGKISHYGFQDIDQIRKEIEKELNRRTESTSKSVALALPRLLDPINGKLVKFLEALSEVTESTTRLAVYIASRETGLSKAEAARLSRNATVDFQRRGKYGSAFGALYAFANANIQGNVRMLRTLRKSKIARRAAMSLAVAGMLMTYWNMAVSPEDEDKKRGYEKRKYWERERNIFIYWPGAKNPIKIPLGYGLNVFWMMGEQIAMRMLGKVSTTDALGNVVGTIASAFNPMGSEGSWFDWKTWVNAYTPTVMRPAPELGFNRNWFGGTIHPDEMPWNRHQPHSDQHKAFTHPAAVAVAEGLNRLTGGNKFEPGAVSLYPDSIEYGWNFAVGGLGRFLANTSGTIADVVDGVDRPVERIPFVRRFVASDNSPAVQSEAYYKARTEQQSKAQRLRAAVKARAEGTDDGSADSVIERLAGETGARPSKSGKGISTPADTIFRSADSQIKELRKQEDAIRKDEKISRADRKTQIDGLRQQMRDVMGEARARVPATAQ